MLIWQVFRLRVHGSLAFPPPGSDWAVSRVDSKDIRIARTKGQWHVNETQVPGS